MTVHLVFTYSAWLLLVAKVSVTRFFKAFLAPAFFAMGVNSSLVTLPHTLRALDSLGVSRKAATLTTCIGTNLNNDGVILYEGFTLLALAQAFGMNLTLGEQVLAAVTCLVAAMGVAGIPEAGVVALTLVLGTFGLPPEALALLLSVDWIVARGRSVLNVASDMVGATVLDRFVATQSGEVSQPSAGSA
jgi:DAACS family dicarboxylate/amino acid:cation (Na+ or H+) symporter